MAKSYATVLLRATINIIVLLLVASGCADGANSEARRPVGNNTSTTTEPSKDLSNSAPGEAVELAQTNQFNLLAPGSYVSDKLSLNLAFATTTEFNVSVAQPGSILFESSSSTAEAYEGVGMFVVDTLLDSGRSGNLRSRPEATLDLSDFLSSRDAISVTATREDNLGGLPARVWRIVHTDDPCNDCWFEPLFSRPGWVNLWGTSPGYVMEVWTVDGPGAPIIVTVEAPEERFEEWAAEVDQHLFDRMQFGEATGFSLKRPTGAFGEGFGEYATGRVELSVVDSSRATIEISNDAGLVVPSADTRTLLLSVAYPSSDGGFGASPATGSFPLVIVAPALHDAGSILPADRQLASHGFVVLSVRFPETSFPGSGVVGVPHQPGDISFVIDAIGQSALPADLAKVVDLDHIGLIGHSAGATTAFGLLAYECCQDDRFAAIVAHAGTVYGFESTQVPSSTPILHVVSQDDQVSPANTVRAFHQSTNGPTAIAELDFVSHLGWLRPGAPSYDDAFELVLAYLDVHLRGGQADFASMVSGTAFVEYAER